MSKTFPGQVALNRASLTVRSGEIHALLGQNGSGKSTLIKVLVGYHKPDPGADVELFGRPLYTEGHILGDANKGHNDVRVMHQDLGLVGSLNVMENLALGRGFHATRAGKINWAAERKHARELLEEFGMRVDPSRPVSTLTRAEQALVGLARAMEDWDPAGGLLILDEPTATMPRTEVEGLFMAMRRVAGQGAGILFVTHRLEEVFEVADKVTVLRDGRTVGSGRVADLTHESVVELIVGRAMSDLYAEPPDIQGETVYEASGVWGEVVEDFSLSLRRGEIVGIAGIVGDGREEVGPLLAGVARRAAGTVRVAGHEVGSDPQAGLRYGLAYLPPGRTESVVAVESVGENILLGQMRRLFRHGWLGHRAAKREATRWIELVDIRPADPSRQMNTLSGGNQQKVVLARMLRSEPVALILDEPTQGVDVGAKAAIYNLLADAARAGAAIIVSSSDSEELANICDRVAIIRAGRLGAELVGNRISTEAIVEACLR